MRKIFSRIFAIALATTLWSCEREFPNPEMPDASKVRTLTAVDINDFKLIAPASGTTVDVDLNSTTPIVIKWDTVKATNKLQVTYKWQAVAVATPTFATPLLNLVSDNAGKNPSLTFTPQDLHAALGAAPVNLPVGSTVEIKWNVEVTTSAGVKKLANNAFTVKLYRKPQTTTVTFELVNYPKSTPTNGKVYLAGEFGVLGSEYSGNWQVPGSVSALQATKVGDSYKVTFQMLSNTTIGAFKWFFVTDGMTGDARWSQGERRFRYSDGNEEGMPNRSWTFTGTNVNPLFSVAKWENLGSAPTQLSKFVVKPDAAVVIPAGKSVYVAGEISGTSSYSAYFAKSGNWQQPGTNPANQLTFDSGSGEWYVWLPVGNAGNKEFKPFVSSSSGDVDFADNKGWGNGMAKADCTGETNRAFNFTGTNGPTFTGVKFEKVAPCPL